MRYPRNYQRPKKAPRYKVEKEPPKNARKYCIECCQNKRASHFCNPKCRRCQDAYGAGNSTCDRTCGLFPCCGCCNEALNDADPPTETDQQEEDQQDEDQQQEDHQQEGS